MFETNESSPEHIPLCCADGNEFEMERGRLMVLSCLFASCGFRNSLAWSQHRFRSASPITTTRLRGHHQTPFSLLSTLAMSCADDHDEQDCQVVNASAKRIVKPAADERRGRVLMFHGWAQNANVLRMKTKTLTK